MNVGIAISGLAGRLVRRAVSPSRRRPRRQPAARARRSRAARRPRGPRLRAQRAARLFLGGPADRRGSGKRRGPRRRHSRRREGERPWVRSRRERGAERQLRPRAGSPPDSGRVQLRGPCSRRHPRRPSSPGHQPRARSSSTGPRMASWFGPGFYGRETACGQRLTRTILGVANRRLPCGTQVQVSYRGQRDRGPGDRPRTVRPSRELGPHLGGRQAAADDGDEPRRSAPIEPVAATPSSLSMSPIRSMVLPACRPPL